MSETPKGVADHPNKDIMEEIWRSGGRAQAIHDFLVSEGLPLVGVRTIARYGQRNWSESTHVSVEGGNPSAVAEIIDAYSAIGLSPRKVGLSTKNTLKWEKDEEGVNQQVDHDLVTQTIDFYPDNSLKFEKATLASITIISEAATKASKPSGWFRGINYPDMQIGFHRGHRGDLTSTHDYAALDVAHQINAYEESKYKDDGGMDVTINSGDNLDFPSFTHHLSGPGYMDTVQITIDAAGTEAQTQRELNPSADLYWLEGNHEYRLIKELIDKMPSLVGVARANEDEPLISIPSLLRFDECEMQYVGAYPDGVVWINDNCRFIHGKLVGTTPGSTAGKLLAKDHYSTISGHIHRQELAAITRQTRDGFKTMYGGSFGTLARVDGVLPSASTGIQATGRQTTKSRELWQQGIGLFWFEKEGSQRVRFETVVIEDGEAIHDGKLFRSTVDKNGGQL